MRTGTQVVLGLLVVGALHAEAGSVKGVVRAKQDLPGEVSAASKKYGKRSLKFARKVEYTQFQDFVVYLEPTDGRALPKVERSHEVRQKNATFIPQVLPVQVGSSVAWPNDDEIFHNVFSVTPGAIFDLGFYRNESKVVRFEQAARVDIFCSIHKEMHCIVLVLDTPWFDKSDGKGLFSIPDVPPGRYQLTAWHQRMPPLIEQVVVPEQGDVELDLVLTVGTGVSAK